MATELEEGQYFDKGFWSEENQKYDSPHFRLEKCARTVNRLAGPRNCDLLDVGCGPGTLERLLRPNIRYHGIDIALTEARPNLLEKDILKSPIRFHDRRFDLIVAQGLFEYMGEHQDQKLAEIAKILKPEGTFVTTYVNFGHRSECVYEVYNNVQPFDRFHDSLKTHFNVESYFPSSHNWRPHEPGRAWMKLANMRMNPNVPYISRKLAVEYFFVCRPLAAR
jgi:SAM-dependent methyltransferase